MILTLLLIAIVSALVFWGVGRILPKLGESLAKLGRLLKTRILPILLSPLALVVLKRLVWLLIRLILRR